MGRKSIVFNSAKKRPLDLKKIPVFILPEAAEPDAGLRTVWLALDLLLEQGVERGADREGGEDPQDDDNCCHGEAAGSHEDVHQAYVDDDGGEESERERDIAVDEEENCRNDLKKTHCIDVVGLQHCGGELSQGSGGHGGVEEIEKNVGTGKEEEGGEQIAGDGGSDLHFWFSLNRG